MSWWCVSGALKGWAIETEDRGCWNIYVVANVSYCLHIISNQKGNGSAYSQWTFSLDVSSCVTQHPAKVNKKQAKQQNRWARAQLPWGFAGLECFIQCFNTHMCVVVFMLASSVVFSFVGLLGPHGVLRDRGQRRASHAGRLHNLDVPTGQTRHQLLARCATSEEEIVGHSGQNSTNNRPEPIDLKAGGRAELQRLRGMMSDSNGVTILYFLTW